MSSKTFVWCVAAAACLVGFVFAGAMALAGEGGDAEAAERAERAKIVERAMRALQLKKAGKELTEEDEKAIRKFERLQEDMKRVAAERRAAAERERERMLDNARPPAPGARPLRPGEDDPGRRLKHDRRLNVIDAAYYEIAEIRLARKQYEEAVAALRQLVASSPDPRAVALTRLNLAELYRGELGNNEQAIQEYKQVTGEFAAEAQRRLAELFGELDQIDEAVEHFEGVAKNATDKTQQVLALRQLADLLVRSGRTEDGVAVLQRLIKAVSYDEAADIAKTLAESEERRDAAERRDDAERTRALMMRPWQPRVQPLKPPPDRELRPDPARIRPQEPKKKPDPPHEEPIRPGPDDE